ncbi:2-methylisocitrate lyase [Pseudonocardia sulfidoxydans NBRC 16205]|uniref:2-methylisocitrate lyase n=1 Tax=Pseudonocardia sulfidoxydans NBRC 16205 TaxID=1223511 RepID=A0A511DAL2_9PSEU|nr:isocitrate lyase/phosphoenolpyruvate mutase family protein [Pseudonocardia sulfidoxydans]GEL21842.1 2-methylisocitrate lyase [Pseudonocardia sulfidoxydans NBRC 16205]
MPSAFSDLHHRDTPLLIPNPWDAGSARLLASLGFRALATTSSGFAGTLGRRDGGVTRDEALAHAATIVAATDLPVSADLENGFGHAPGDVAATITAARGAGLAGGSVEDFTGDAGSPIYARDAAVERIAAATSAAGGEFVLTARCENLLHGVHDLADTIERLQAYQEAGADVLYAPGLARIADVETVVRNVDRPVNVLLVDGGPTVAELGRAGVARISVGGTFFYAASGALIDAGKALLDGDTSFFANAATGREGAAAAFT